MSEADSQGCFIIRPLRIPGACEGRPLLPHWHSNTGSPTLALLHWLSKHRHSTTGSPAPALQHPSHRLPFIPARPSPEAISNSSTGPPLTTLQLHHTAPTPPFLHHTTPTSPTPLLCSNTTYITTTFLHCLHYTVFHTTYTTTQFPHHLHQYTPPTPHSSSPSADP